MSRKEGAVEESQSMMELAGAAVIEYEEGKVESVMTKSNCWIPEELVRRKRTRMSRFQASYLQARRKRYEELGGSVSRRVYR